MPDGTRIRDARPRDRRKATPGVVQQAPPSPEPRPPSLGGHVLTLFQDRARCTACGCSSSRIAWFASQKCMGSTALRWARAIAASSVRGMPLGTGHRRAISDSVVWCIACGCYAEHTVRGLAQRCKGRATGTARARLLALHSGRHPRSGVSLPPAIYEFGPEDLPAVETPAADLQAARAAGQPAQAAPDAAGRLAALRARVRARQLGAGTADFS